MLPPLLVMLVLIAGTAAAAWGAMVVRRRRSGRVAAMAARWRMSYTAGDRFLLTPKVAARFPTPGAADVVLRDLIYGPVNGDPTGGGLRYLFTVEYTTGVLRTKRRRVGVAMLAEVGNGAADGAVTLAPSELPIPQQYEHLREHAGGAGDAPAGRGGAR